MLILLSSLAAATPDAAALTALWQTHRASIERLGTMPVSLREKDLASLAAGETVTRVITTEDGVWAMGAIWLDSPPLHLWVVAHDRTDRSMSKGSVTNTELPTTAPYWRITHAVLDLPWPITDRQWVALHMVNKALLDATQGAVWERTFTLGDPALTATPDPDAVWLGDGGSGWVMVAGEGGTLAIFSARSVSVAGIPEELLGRWALSQIRSSFVRMRAYVGDITEHYSTSHAVIPDPWGRPIQPADLR